MNLLCLDTSTDYATVIVGNDAGDLYAERSSPHERSLSTRMYPLIEDALSQANLTVQEIDVFAVGIGPGSFTGVRVAVTTMRTLAQVTGKKLVGICTLDILAKQAMQSPSGAGSSLLHVVLPSRRNEVYVATYDNHANRLADPLTASYEDIRNLARNEHAAVSGPAALLDMVFIGIDANRIPLESPDATAFLALAGRQIRLGAFENPLALDPMYIALPAVSQHKNSPQK